MSGQVHAERGFRFLKDPQFLAAALYLQKPERIMALLMVTTVCLLVYAALEYRIRQALKDHEATSPDQKGKPIANPTARWVFHYFVGIHLLCPAGSWPMVLNLTKSIAICFGCWGNLTCGFMTSNIPENEKTHAECRLQLTHVEKGTRISSQQARLHDHCGDRKGEYKVSC